MYQHRNQHRDQFARRLYGLSAWKSLARSVVEAADRCAYCGRTDVQLTADHVVALRLDPSLALDPDNLRAACRSCQEYRKHDPTWTGPRGAVGGRVFR
jgi:5-methylcytosine-specific restriction endonuclease McrA